MKIRTLAAPIAALGLVASTPALAGVTTPARDRWPTRAGLWCCRAPLAVPST